jgi:UDP-N-acetylmuramyl pentapeptide phosphotransferase/UDP-N-acetylglucosamine-1-phosphate transferase
MEIDFETGLQIAMFCVAFIGMYLGFLKDSI